VDNKISYALISFVKIIQKYANYQKAYKYHLHPSEEKEKAKMTHDFERSKGPRMSQTHSFMGFSKMIPHCSFHQHKIYPRWGPLNNLIHPSIIWEDMITSLWCPWLLMID